MIVAFIVAIINVSFSFAHSHKGFRFVFKGKFFKKLLDISDEYDVSCVIGFGYPTHTSAVVDAENNDIKYRLDDGKNYIVPKRKIEDTVTEI